MNEIYTSMEFRKFISEEVGDTTYIAMADYKASPTADYYWYEKDADKAKPIRRIKKIVENNWVTETFYPEWDPSKLYARDERATLDYI